LKIGPLEPNAALLLPPPPMQLYLKFFLQQRKGMTYSFMAQFKSSSFANFQPKTRNPKLFLFLKCLHPLAIKKRAAKYMLISHKKNSSNGGIILTIR
jgi:hypothetical protein